MSKTTLLLLLLAGAAAVAVAEEPCHEGRTAAGWAKGLSSEEAKTRQSCAWAL